MASSATLRSFFYSRSDQLGGRVFPRTKSSFLSQDIIPRLGRKNRCEKKTQLCDPRLRKTSSSVGEGKGVDRDGSKKKRRTVTPDIGTDTKSLICPVGFFLQVDETPFPRAGIPPLLCILSEYAREKKNAATLYPVMSPLLTSDPGKENTPHCHIGD